MSFSAGSAADQKKLSLPRQQSGNAPWVETNRSRRRCPQPRALAAAAANKKEMLEERRTPHLLPFVKADLTPLLSSLKRRKNAESTWSVR
uniref:Uncharacterized protein n=1 Tax=Steinernema glaseri TaxID=37863 RepID=A0A1I8AF02_9BILA